jgi:anti-anti-sigma regulatory factor
VTTLKSSRNRKPSTRVQAKRATGSAAKAVPAAVPAVRPAAEADRVSAAATAAGPRMDTDASSGISVQLEPSLEIKDADGVHRLLSAALGDGRAITVDVGRVHSVDTAGAQLLLAFQSEANRRGVTIKFHGESAALTHTLAVLGLGGNFAFAVSHG